MPYARSITEAVEALRDLGPNVLTATQCTLLRNLTDGDRRVVGAGLHDRIILDDERIRAAARKVPQASTG